MEEIVPGLFHWRSFHERIRQEVSSYYYEPARALIDPRVPSESLGWFRGREPRLILLTNRHHYRHSRRFQDAFDCPVFCHRAGLHEFAGNLEEVKGFSFGEEVAPEIVALEVAAICPEETALYLREAGGGAMAFADGLVRSTYDGSLGFVPDFLLGDDPEEVKRGLRQSLRRLLDERFENLLFAHGRPLVGGGKEALSVFLAERTVW
jgi:glyoxylase-like metal-dependent hydrolase (beta-lactamase superfamily II)